MQVKKQQLEWDMEQQSGSKLGKKYVKAVYCQSDNLTSMKSTLSKMPGCMKHKLESGLQGEISITSDTQMTPPLWQKVKRNLRASWRKWRGEWKVGLKLSIQKMKIMASGPITPREIDGETVETVSDFIFGGSKITADGDYIHKIKKDVSLEEKLWPT